MVGGGNSGSQIAVELSKDRKVYISVGHKLIFLPQTIANKNIFWWFDKLGVLNANVNSKMGKILSKRQDPIFGQELKSLLKLGKVILKPRVHSAVNNNVRFDDNSEIEVNNVIWSTGFKHDYSWIDVHEVFYQNGGLIHQRGITPVKGLYFLGLPRQYRRGSALLQGIGNDAEYLYMDMTSK